MRKLPVLLSLLLFSAWCRSQPPAANYHWHGWAPFYLSIPFLKEAGIEDLMPFGFRLTPQSQVRLQANGRESYPVKTSDTTLLQSVTYFLVDSVVKKVQLHINPNRKGAAATLKAMLKRHFGRYEFSNSEETAYSDDDFLASLDTKSNMLCIQSLDHQPLEEQRIMEVNLRTYRDDGRFWFSLSDQEAIGLEFYNQITKENNVQLAFRLHYQGASPMALKQVCFEPEGAPKMSFPVSPVTSGGTEKVTHCFIRPEDARRLAKAQNVRVTLLGKTVKSYYLPTYQLHSLKTALQFYKENVTDPLIQYNGW